MNISILSVFPDLYQSFLKTSLVGRAQEKNAVTITLDSFFDYVEPKERIDAPTFGPGAGMVLRPDVVQKAIETREQKTGKAFKIFFSPHGKKLDQKELVRIAGKVQECGHLMLIPARYEGMDTRVEQVYADQLISIGDFVLMGGDLPAMILIEGLLRLLPAVVGKQESVENDSFSGPFVDYPEFTAPVEWHGLQVPDVVRSGHHAEIKAWRKEQAVKRTVLSHFDWLRSHRLDDADKELAKKYMPNHYVVLAHSEVLIGRQERVVGTTSVTSIDIHDIARSSATYGIEQFFIVTPLLDQQRVVEVMLDFWQKGIGLEYNKNRAEAVNRVRIVDSIDKASAAIEEKEGVKPILVATSARSVTGAQGITFHDQETVWALGRPVLFIFGTGQGLTAECISRCDFLLPPVEGFSSFRHLSVRSAVAIILDKWMGFSVKK